MATSLSNRAGNRVLERATAQPNGIEPAKWSDSVHFAQANGCASAIGFVGLRFVSGCLRLSRRGLRFPHAARPPRLDRAPLHRGQARSAGQVASAVGISRQAAHRHLAALVAAGQLRAEGRGRAARYRGASSLPFSRRYPRAIAEDRVWSELSSELPALGKLGREARSVFQYAFTEMLNNAIEHSGSRRSRYGSRRSGEDWRSRSSTRGAARSPISAAPCAFRRTSTRSRS